MMLINVIVLLIHGAYTNSTNLPSNHNVRTFMQCATVAIAHKIPMPEGHWVGVSELNQPPSGAICQSRYQCQHPQKHVKLSAQKRESHGVKVEPNKRNHTQYEKEAGEVGQEKVWTNNKLPQHFKWNRRTEYEWSKELRRELWKRHKQLSRREKNRLNHYHQEARVLVRTKADWDKKDKNLELQWQLGEWKKDRDQEDVAIERLKSESMALANSPIHPCEGWEEDDVTIFDSLPAQTEKEVIIRELAAASSFKHEDEEVLTRELAAAPSFQNDDKQVLDWYPHWGRACRFSKSDRWLISYL